MHVLEEVSTITAKGQTTVPKSVRKLLGVDVGGQIAFRVEGQKVTLHPVETEHVDPMLEDFLDFIARDIQKRPEGLKGLSSVFAARIAKLTRGKKVELDAPIDGDADL